MWSFKTKQVARNVAYNSNDRNNNNNNNNNNTNFIHSMQWKGEILYEGICPDITDLESILMMMGGKLEYLEKKPWSQIEID